MNVPALQRRPPLRLPGSVRLRHARGFTLLEMLIVLVLMVMAAGLVIPSLLSTGTVQIKSASRMIAAGLQSSREYAINRQQPVSLVIDVARRLLTVPGRSQPRQLSEKLQLEVLTARSELLDEQRAGIRFFPDGSSSGGRITIRRGKHQAYVDVDWLTGQVNINKGIPVAPVKRLTYRVQLPSRLGS